MHADDAGGRLGGRGDAGDRNRRCVGGEDRVGAADAVEIAHHRFLQVELLEHRFDDDVAVGEILDRRRRLDPPKRRVLVGGRQLAARDEAIEALPDRPHAAVERRLGNVAELTG